MREGTDHNVYNQADPVAVGQRPLENSFQTLIQQLMGSVLIGQGQKQRGQQNRRGNWRNHN